MRNQTIQHIRDALTEVETSGQTSVDIAALRRFCDALEQDLPVDSEVRKLNHDSKLAHYKATVDAKNEMFRSVLLDGKDSPDN